MDLTVPLACCLAGLSLLWWWSTRRPAGLPPGPGPALPVIGHLYLIHKDPRAQFTTWRQQFGDMFTLVMGGQLMVVLNGYDVIREALVKQADAFSDRPKTSMFDLVTKAKGIGDTSGPLWKAQRKVTMEILRQFGMGKNVLAQKVQGEVGQFLQALTAKDSLPFDPSRLVQVSVSNNICSIAFGQRFEYDDDNFLRLVETMEEMLKLSGGASLTAFLPFLRHVPGDPFKIQRAVDCYHSIVDTFLIPAIQQHVQDAKVKDGPQPDDFISAYLRETKLAPNRGLADFVNEFNLQKVLMDLFAAGTDTTAVTIRWAIIYLLHYPQVQDRCYQDIVKVTGASRPPEIADRAEMTYVEATIMEVLRVAEVTPLGVIHSTACDVVLRGFTLPKDTVVLPNLDSVLHDPAVWEEPAVFRPDRFLDAQGHLVRPDEFLPFSTGRRVCPGESFARMELFLYLSAMIAHFRFLPPEDGQLPSLQGTIGLVHSPQPFLVRAVSRDSSTQ